MSSSFTKKVPSPCNEVGIKGLKMDELRALADRYNVKKPYPRAKADLCAAIHEKGDAKLKYWMQDYCIREAAKESEIVQDFLKTYTREGRAKSTLRYMPYITGECAYLLQENLFIAFMLEEPFLDLLSPSLTRFYQSGMSITNFEGLLTHSNLNHMKDTSFFIKYLGKPRREAITDYLARLFRLATPEFRKAFYEYFFSDQTVLLSTINTCYPQFFAGEFEETRKKYARQL